MVSARSGTSRKADCSSSRLPAMRRSSSCPDSVGTARPPVRSKSGTPSTCSSSAICSDNAGCEIEHSRAASLKLGARIAALK